MDFPIRLASGPVEDNTAEVGALVENLRGCNDDVEAIFGSGTHDQPSEMNEDVVIAALNESAMSLRLALLAILRGQSDLLPARGDHSDEVTDALALLDTEPSILEETSRLLQLSEILRACKNLMRWYMQVFLSTHVSVSPSPLQRLQDARMVELYWKLLQMSSGDADNSEKQNVARHACLSLFYATYSPSLEPSRIVEEAQRYLVESLEFFASIMPILVKPNTPAVLLSVIRIVHNLLASCQAAAREVEKCSLLCEEPLVPWIPASEQVDLRSLLSYLLLWILEMSPAFPGKPEDRRLDLALELLRVLYVLRAGRQFGPNPNSPLTRTLRLLLETTNDSDDALYECKVATIALLMDAPQSFANILTDMDLLPSLLAFLDRQVSLVVDTPVVGNAAAAALVPILTALTQFSRQADCCQKVKGHIFPPEAEEAFAVLAAAEMTRNATGESGIGAKNMHPLDAPKGSLRWKMIRLMTWTESNTKRAASELLWTVCNSNAKEFVLRTGLGNALPMLGLKKKVDLPPQLS